MNAKRNQTMKARMQRRITALDGDVVLRREVADLGSPR